MNVKIEIIPHEQQRYPTVGDWLFEPNGDLTIRVSKLSDWRKEMLVAIHELVEVVLCKHDGVAQETVDKFDITYEKDRKDGNDDEPGDDPGSPYMEQHCVATGVERVLAARLGVCWRQYEDELYNLP